MFSGIRFRCQPHNQTQKFFAHKVCMKNLWSYLLLIKGNTATRCSILASYIIVPAYILILAVFFSMPPGPSSAMIARMDRSMTGIIVIGGLFLAALIWLKGFVNFYRSRDLERNILFQWLMFALPIPCFIIMANIYNWFLSGHSTVIHSFFYDLQRYL